MTYNVHWLNRGNARVGTDRLQAHELHRLFAQKHVSEVGENECVNSVTK